MKTRLIRRVFLIERRGLTAYTIIMKILFSKYHALGNDFLIVDTGKIRIPRARRSELSLAICHRNTGVGADGVLFVSSSRKADLKVELYNADGSTAEKSGNGLRSVAFHCVLGERNKKSVTLEMDGVVHIAKILKRSGNSAMIETGLGEPSFEAADVPVKTKERMIIKTPLKLGNTGVPVTCLSVGNPHTVLLVPDFDFDWKELGAAIEIDPAFPQQTNVEFVKPVNRRKLHVADWERGAGATGSSGTGAAAAVCACVMMGLADRKCEVVFDNGSLMVNWDTESNIIRLTGPIEKVANGEYYF